MELLLDFLPLLIIFAVIAIFIWASWRRSTANMDRAVASNNEIVQATRSMVVELREIKEILKDRKS